MSEDTTRAISPSSGRTQETFDAYGHDIRKPVDYSSVSCCTEVKEVPHQTIDNDVLRKRENNYRHHSYRK